MKSRFRSNAVTKEETEDTLLRAMLYEPFPGNAAVVLSRLGFLGSGQIDGLGARTFDAESGRLSLTMDDGRVVELERAVHPHIDNRYAVSVQSREGVVVDRGFILIDRDSNGKDLGVTDLLNNRMAYAEAEGGTHEGQEFSDGGADFEPGAEEDVRVEEPEAVGELVETATVEGVPEVEAREGEEEELPVVVEEHVEAVVGEAEGHELPYGDTPEVEDSSGVEEAGPVVQNVESQIYSEPEIAVEAEESGIDAEPIETQAATVEAEPEVETEAVESLTAAVEVEPEVVAEAGEIAEPEAGEAVAAIAPEPVRKVSDRERYYGPLFQALEANEAVLFGWVAETGTIQTYEHKETGRYLHLDAASGLFYDQTRTPISKIAALRHAMRPLVVETVPVVEEEPLVVTAGATKETAAIDKPKPAAHGDELGLDAFVRKADEPIARDGGRESWKSRFAGLSRALKLKRNQNGHEAMKDEGKSEE